MSTKAEFNRDLGLRINREIWNGGDLSKVAEYFSADFLADRSPAG